MRRHKERGDRTEQAIKQAADKNKNPFANVCGNARISIHHRLASNPAKRNSPKRLSNVNPPRNIANPRGNALTRKSASQFFALEKSCSSGLRVIEGGMALRMGVTPFMRSGNRR